MKKRIISVFLTAAFALQMMTLTGNQTFAIGEEFGSSGAIVEGSAAIDILLNAGTNSEFTAGELAPKVEEYLRQMLDSAGMEDTQVRVNVPVVDLDTSDLSDWYVYDHYDVQHYLSGNANTKVGSALTINPGSYTNNPPAGASYNNTNLETAYKTWKTQSESEKYTERFRPWFPINASTNTNQMPAVADLYNTQDAKDNNDPAKNNPLLTNSLSAVSTTVVNNSTGYLPKMTVAQWVDRTFKGSYSAGNTGSIKTRNDGRPHNSASAPAPDGYYVDSIGVYDKHIYNHSIDGIAYIDFAGYYTGSFTDFVYYPCPSQELKRVTFDIDGSNVNAHSLNGAGFLINAGIDANGNLIGYYLYYDYYGGTTTASNEYPKQLKLYKLNGNKKAELIHNSIADGNSDEIRQNSTLIQTVSINSSSWNPKMSIRLSITPTALLVEQKPQSSDDSAYSTVLNIDGSTGNTLDRTGYNGFGPMVHYRSTGHTCVRASQFTYSNLKMAYIAQSDDIFKVLSEANYVQNADLYFVDLTEDGKKRALSSDGTDAAAYMQAKGIDYVTNYTNELLSDGTGADSPPNENAPLGEYGKTIYGANSADDLAREIAKYIFDSFMERNESGNFGKDYGENRLPLANPVALLSLVSNTDETKIGSSFIDTVKRDLISETGLSVYGYDIKSLPSDKCKIDGTIDNDEKYSLLEYNYDISFPDGREVSKSYTKANQTGEEPLFQITNNRTDWPVGEYTVILTVKDNNGAGKTSLPVSTKFYIIEDTTAPAVPAVIIQDNKLSFSTNDKDTYNDGTEEGIFNSFITGYELKIIPKSEAAITIPEYDGIAGYNSAINSDGVIKVIFNVTASDGAESRVNDITFDNIPLPVGDYTATLTVYDKAGNKTAVEIPHIDYINETLSGLKNSKDYGGFGTTAANGTTLSITGFISADNPADKSYTTANAAGSSDGRTVTGNNTMITVVIPARPAAPGENVKMVVGGSDCRLIGINNTMEYKKSDVSDYTSVSDGTTSVNGLVKESYHVRYKSVDGSAFTSSVKTITPGFYTVTLDVRKDGEAWSNNGKTFTFRIGSDGNPLYAESDGSFVVENGITYKIYDGITDTGNSVYINSASSNLQINYYTVSCYKNASDGAAYHEQVVLGGKNAVEPVSPEKNGYVFEGWKKDSSVWDFDTETVSETITLVAEWSRITRVVEITFNKDDELWTDFDKDITLVLESGSYTAALIGFSDGIATFNAEALDDNDVYKILINGEDIGFTVAVPVGGNTVTQALDYYTVTFSVQNTGTDSASAINAFYGGTEINSGDVVPGGKDLTITAAGKGANAYAYIWNNTGTGITSGQTSAFIATENLSGAVNAVCTVNGTDAKITVSGEGLNGFKIGEEAVGAKVIYTIDGSVGFKFESDGILCLSDFTIDNLPDGLTTGIPNRVNDYVVEIAITGTPVTYNSSSAALTTATSISYGNVVGAVENSIQITGNVSIALVKGDKATPSNVNVTDVTVYGGSDGIITGLDENIAYEYKLNSESDGCYKVATINERGEITGLPAGIYQLRLQEDENYNASPAATVTTNQPNLVTLIIK